MVITEPAILTPMSSFSMSLLSFSPQHNTGRKGHWPPQIAKNSCSFLQSWMSPVQMALSFPVECVHMHRPVQLVNKVEFLVFLGPHQVSQWTQFVGLACFKVHINAIGPIGGVLMQIVRCSDLHQWHSSELQWKSMACKLNKKGESTQSPAVLQCCWPQCLMCILSAQHTKVSLWNSSFLPLTCCGSILISVILSLIRYEWKVLELLKKSQNTILTAPVPLSVRGYTP